MATHLAFAKLPHVKNGIWSIKQKICYKTGLARTDFNVWGNQAGTYFDSPLDLTEQQIEDVTTIITDENAQGPDVNLQVINNSYIMRDPFDWHDWIENESGIYCSVWYRSTNTYPGRNDEVVIIPTDSTHTMQHILTNPQKSALEDAILAGNRWE